MRFRFLRSPRSLRSPLDLSPLREHAQFRLLWSSRTVTLLGTQVAQVALLVQARQLTGSPVLVGLLGAVEVVPLVIFGLYGGVLADRLDRRRLAVWTEAGLGLTAVALTVNGVPATPASGPVVSFEKLDVAVNVAAVTPVKGSAVSGSPLGALSWTGLTGGAVAAPLTVASKAIGNAMAAVSLAAIEPRNLFDWDAFMVSTFFTRRP